MPKPVIIPSGALPITDADITKVEDFIASLARVMKNGSTGATNPALLADPTFLPDPSNPGSFIPLLLDDIEGQRFFRQLGHAILNSLSGGTGSSGVFSATAGETLIIGDLVYISAANTVRKANSTDGAKMTSVGVVTATGSSLTVQFTGLLSSTYTGLVAGDTYFVGSNGRPTSSPPNPVSGGTNLWISQVVGTALDSTSMILFLTQNVVQYYY